MAKKNADPSVTIELRNLMHAQPFQEFDIKTTDGDTFHIIHPDFFAISPMGDTAVVYDRADQGHTVLNLQHVVSMEPTRPKKGLLGQGGGKR